MAMDGFLPQPLRRAPVAIYGLGRAGSIHFGNLVRNPRAEIRYIVEECREKAEQAIRDWSLEKTCEAIGAEDEQTVYADPSILAIIVCTPTDAHERIVRASLKAAKSVFCEKPVATSITAVNSCYEEAEKNGCFLFCAFNRRHDPSIRLLRQRVQEGTLGQVQCIKTCSRDFQMATVEYLSISGGIFHDTAVHDIDVICWILGEFPDEVFALGHAFHNEVADCGDVDQVAITMKFPSGTIATIDLNREACYGYDQRIEVFGTKGMLETKNTSSTTVTSHKDTEGCTQSPIETLFARRYAQSYTSEMEYFIKHILGLDVNVEVTRKEAVMASVIAEACHQSCKRGIPIQVNKDL
ncbi:uncharacterized protein LOC110978999 isoform X2 [Acanthaster planci]|uniref:Uncharacterized protein LOC110978999 isoform X2 n=1 Tax=Acanthaster planci TaxID=133434 RepID=A0A8B7YEQ7_ACAPL|nr:uncharacterized protein LOC110978999 isoform X2 [Acanthaster planci]